MTATIVEPQTPNLDKKLQHGEAEVPDGVHAFFKKLWDQGVMICILQRHDYEPISPGRYRFLIRDYEGEGCTGQDIFEVFETMGQVEFTLCDYQAGNAAELHAWVQEHDKEFFRKMCYAYGSLSDHEKYIPRGWFPIRKSADLLLAEHFGYDLKGCDREMAALLDFQRALNKTREG